MQRILLAAVRFGIPAAVVLTGIVLTAIGGLAAWEGAAMFIGAGFSILLLNLLFRYGVAGDEERRREEAARRYFDRHGRWPTD